MKFIPWLHLWRQRTDAVPLEQENLLEDVLLRVLASIDSRLGASGHRFPVRTVLLALSPSCLVDIDHRMRSPRRPRGDDLPDDLLDRVSRPDIDGATREACQFLVSMHRSGHLRERALRAMDPGGSRLALAASLLRCVDWVDPIRKVATDMADRLLDRSTDDDVFALMPLIYRMRRHARFPHDHLDPKLEAWLSSSDERIKRALTSFAPLKRWALRLLFEQRAPVEPHVLEQAIADPDPTIPMIVFERLAELPVASRAIVMASGLRAKHPLVRQYALRAIARDVSRVPLKVLHLALIDRSAGVRSFAAHTLRTQYHDEPAAFLRGLVDAGKAPWSAYLSLAQHASAADESRLRRGLDHPFARVRAAALLALMRLGMRATDAEFVRFANDRNSRVRRVLAGFCRSGDIPLGSHRLRLLWTELPDSAAGPAGELLDALPAGERLDLLFAFEPTTEAERRWWNGMLDVWSDSALGWWETEPALRVRLAGLLERWSPVLELPLRIRLEKGAAR